MSPTFPILLAVGAVASLAFRIFIRSVPVRFRWTGFVAAIVAGVATGLVTRPPREEWGYLHAFESALSQHVIPPTIGLLALFAATVMFRRAGLSDTAWVAIGVVLFFVVTIVTASGMLILCCG